MEGFENGADAEIIVGGGLGSAKAVFLLFHEFILHKLLNFSEGR